MTVSKQTSLLLVMQIIIAASCFKCASSFVPSSLPKTRSLPLLSKVRSQSQQHLPPNLHHQLRMTGDSDNKPRLPWRRAFLASTVAAFTTQLALAKVSPPGFKRIPTTQFIAALGDPNASSGSGAEKWGLWPVDPGPRGVWLNQYKQLESAGGKAPAGWEFDKNDWWLEEHGLIMEKPNFPLKPGRYLVTGGRMVTTDLTVDPPDQNGVSRWKLGGDAKLYDVTHLPCRSARYTPISENGSPARARFSDFPVKPGGEMPPVEGCSKQDYAVLFVTGVEA